MKLYLIIGLVFSLGFQATRWNGEEASVLKQTAGFAVGTVAWPLIAGLLAGHVARETRSKQVNQESKP